MKTNGNIISRSTLNNLSAYWLFNNGKYIYCERYSSRVRAFPTISIEYKGILEDHGILYIKVSDTVLEFWDENCYEEVDITLPTFIPWEDGYRQVKDHTGSVITKETYEAAFALNVNVVLPAIDELRRQKEMEKRELEAARKREALANMLVRAMGESNTAIVEADLIYLVDISDLETYLKSNGKNFKVFNVHCLSHTWNYEIPTSYVVAFDIDKLPSHGILELQVSEGKEGLFIGTDGWQVKKWAKNLGLRYIYITAMK